MTKMSGAQRRALTASPPKTELGPACKALEARSPKMLIFAMHRASGMTLSKSAAAAGYTTKWDPQTHPAKHREALRSHGSQIIRDDAVQQAIREIVQAQIKGSAGRAVRIVEQIAFGGSAPPNVQLKAATTLIELAGHGAVQQIAVDHLHRVEPETIDDIYRKLGMPVPASLRQITAHAVEPTDAAFEVVEPAPSTAGLEDLLGEPVDDVEPDVDELDEPDDGQGEVEDDDLVMIEED